MRIFFCFSRGPPEHAGQHPRFHRRVDELRRTESQAVKYLHPGTNQRHYGAVTSPGLTQNEPNTRMTMTAIIIHCRRQILSRFV